MDSKPEKVRRRRKIRKTKIKQPSGFKLKLVNFFGTAFLEYSWQIFIAIILFFVLFIGLGLLVLMEPTPIPE